MARGLIALAEGVTEAVYHALLSSPLVWPLSAFGKASHVTQLPPAPGAKLLVDQDWTAVMLQHWPMYPSVPG